MKKIATVILITCLLFALAACGSDVICDYLRNREKEVAL